MKQAREYIKALLDKFLEGQTTEAEEQILSKYFCETNDISPAWQKYKQLFMSFKTDAYDFSKEEIDALLVPNQLKKPSVIPLWTLVSAESAAVDEMFTDSAKILSSLNFSKKRRFIFCSCPSILKSLYACLNTQSSSSKRFIE